MIKTNLEEIRARINALIPRCKEFVRFSHYAEMHSLEETEKEDKAITKEFYSIARCLELDADQWVYRHCYKTTMIEALERMDKYCKRMQEALNEVKESFEPWPYRASPYLKRKEPKK